MHTNHIYTSLNTSLKKKKKRKSWITEIYFFSWNKSSNVIFLFLFRAVESLSLLTINICWHIHAEIAVEAASTIGTVHPPIAIPWPALEVVPPKVVEAWIDTTVKLGKICMRRPAIRPIIRLFVARRPWMNQDTEKITVATTPREMARN